MSGPKSSRYTLTAAQRRAIAEQLEKQRQLRIQAEKDERQRCENLGLCADIDALVKQNDKLIDYARKVQNETGLEIKEVEEFTITSQKVIARANLIRGQIKKEKGNALASQKQELLSTKMELRSLYSALNSCISDAQRRDKQNLAVAIAEGANLTFDVPVNDTHPEEDSTNREAEAKQKCVDALMAIEDSGLSTKLRAEHNAITDKIADIQTTNFFENYYALTIVPFIKECKEWAALVGRIGDHFKTVESEYRILCEEQDEQQKEFEFSDDGLAKLEAEVARLKAVKLDDEEQAYISQTIDDVMVEMGYKLIGNNEVTKKSGKHFKKELYLFEEGTAVNVTTSSTGQITMELGLLDTQDRMPDVEETDTLCRQMRTFCGSYADIEKKLAERGIVSKHISLLPPEAQFAQVINVEDYNMNDDETYVKEKKKAAANEQKTMHF